MIKSYPNNPAPKPKHYLRLFDEDNSVIIAIVGEDGHIVHDGRLIVINENGYDLFTNVNPTVAACLNLPLDDRGNLANAADLDSDDEEEDW